VVREHVAKGGIAVVRQPGVRGDLLAIYDGEHYHPVMWAHDIPATLGGKATVNIQNALAALAIGYASGLSVETMQEALKSFTSSFEQNPGRLNVYEGLPFKVILDYGHNPAGLEPMVKLVGELRGTGRAIGVVSMAGDRRDEDMLELGALASKIFDDIIIREDSDKRGRAEGEIAALLERGVLEAGHPSEAVQVVISELEALQTAMRQARPGDLVVHFSSDIDKAWQCITSFRPELESPPDVQTSSSQGLS
jgi:cyanophycin synthetase